MPFLPTLLVLVLTCHGGRLTKKSRGSSPDESWKAIECEDDFDGTFDLIYTWWTNKRQTKTIHEVIDEAKQRLEASPAASSSFLETASTSSLGVGLQQQREVVYNMRGAQKYGLMAHVRYVHILISDETFDAHGAPIDFNYTDPRLRLISSGKLGIKHNERNPDGGLMVKMSSLLAIPDLHCWAMLLNDDVFPTNTFDVKAFFNFQTKKQVKYRTDSYSWGFCDGHPTTTCHGPFFFSACRMAQVVAKYKTHFDELRTKGQDPGRTADVMCLYDNMGLEEGWAEIRENNGYLMICHTNGGCTEQDYTTTKTMFTNIQGNHLSDEYEGGDRVPQGTLDWFRTHFDVPSIFELPRGAARITPVFDKGENKKITTCAKNARNEGEVVPNREAESATPLPAS